MRAIEYPRLESGTRTVVPMDNRRVRSVPRRGGLVREDDPDRFETRTTERGCVVQFWGMSIYYGKCTRCAGLTTSRRPVGTGGAYPKLCSSCREDPRDQSRKLMAKRRKREYADRAVQYERKGWTPPTQGVPAKDRRTGATIMLTEPEDDFDEWDGWDEDL